MIQFQKISSRENPKIKFARSVRDGREKELIFIEGFRLCQEILKTKLTIHSVFITEKFLEGNPGVEFIQKILIQNGDIFVCPENIFSSIADTKNPQGIIILAKTPLTGQSVVEQNLPSTPFLLLLHQINNPANLGAILRTAEAVGIDGIITTKGTTDVFSAKTLRGAMGANLRLPIWVNADFSEVLRWASKIGLKSVCADIRSEKSYLEIDWKIPRILVFGSEGHGLSSQERQQIDENLVIPMLNSVESLNVAVACGVILFEAKRQRN